MTAQTMSNEWFRTKEGESMKTFKGHGQRITAFRQTHDDTQDVAVVESESFEEHDEKMKAFSRSHTMLKTEPTGPNRHSKPEDLMIPDVPQIEKGPVGPTYPAGTTTRLHLVPGCRLPRRKFSLITRRAEFHGLCPWVSTLK
jgi:hypothetical protein